MVNFGTCPEARPYEAQGRREDDLSALEDIYSSSSEVSTVADGVNIVPQRECRISWTCKERLQAVDLEVGGNRVLRSDEAMGYRDTTVDAAGPGGTPDGSCVGKLETCWMFDFVVASIQDLAVTPRLIFDALESQRVVDVA